MKAFVEELNGEIKADNAVPESNAERKAYEAFKTSSLKDHDLTMNKCKMRWDNP